jgi:toxin ParE1/3/4
MAPRKAGGSRGIVTVSPQAANDLAAIHTYTTHQWDYDQAERYLDFLAVSMDELASNPQFGNRIAARPGLFERIYRWKNAKYGHRIVFQIVPDGIYVLRVLHTSMDLPEHLKQL